MPDQTPQLPVAPAEWQQILTAAYALVPDDKRDAIGEQICEAYSFGVAAGVQRAQAEADRLTAELATLKRHASHLFAGVDAAYNFANKLDADCCGTYAQQLRDAIGKAGTAPVPGSSRRVPEPTDLLRMAADGRREYAESMRRDPAFENVVELLDLQADTIAAAVRVIEGDLGPLYNWLPSWRWTDEMEAALFGKTSGTEPAGESQASEPALTAQCQCGHPHAAHEGPGLPARRCVLCFGCNVYVAELPAQDTAVPAAPKLAQGGIVNLGPTRRLSPETRARLVSGERPIDLDDRAGGQR